MPPTIIDRIRRALLQAPPQIRTRVRLCASHRLLRAQHYERPSALALIGIAIGLAGAFFAARALSAFLFGVGAADPVTFAAVAVVMLAVATLASYIPSRRALQVDPVIALRAE